MEKYIKGLSEIREEIYATIKDRPSPTAVNMARNAIMFLDTAYMWCDSLKHMLDVMDADKAAADPNVQVVDFTGRGN